MSQVMETSAAKTKHSASKAWMRALELTAPIAKNPTRIFPTVIAEAAKRNGNADALVSDRERLTYRGLTERANQYARWALGQGLSKGDVAGLLMTNRPEYMAVWVGLTSVGVVVALLNTNLSGNSLAHCIRTVGPKHIIASSEFVETVSAALGAESLETIWTHGGADGDHPRIDLEIAGLSGEAFEKDEQHTPSVNDLALYIYTSGTTGLPKAANVSHARVMQWSHWFAGMMEVQASDRMYNCLPMYHSVGGVQAPGAVLIAGGTVVLREKFSASQFWNDVVRWDCTLFQYIGELCRYLLHAAPSANETKHCIRLACGNGMAPEVWEAFEERFQIPRILEFYAATEGSVSLFNVQGKRGAIGHIPSYLAHRFAPALVAFDVDAGEPVRNEDGFCVRCAANQPGEALSKVVNDPTNVGSRFEGYTSKEASERKVLRNVFEIGDAWIRTGDLMRRDENGYFYFVDRIGDTFRWKGENVATSEVAETICAFPGIEHANVYGVAVPGTEGRAGMATLVMKDELDLEGLRAHLISRLPAYARPLFLRVRKAVDLTGTFKYSKTELVREGFNPDASEDELYFDSAVEGRFLAMNKELFDRIQDGAIRL